MISTYREMSCAHARFFSLCWKNDYTFSPHNFRFPSPSITVLNEANQTTQFFEYKASQISSCFSYVFLQEERW